MIDNLPPVLINDPTKPLISIVTPSFNQGQFIRATIDSVLTQDYPNIEYWVIDGDSTDNTLAILKEYEGDPRMHWISEKDQGQSDAINKGIMRCRGEIFNWLCSDDIFTPSTLRKVAEAWMAHGKPAIIYGLAKFIDHDGQDIGYCPYQSSNLTLPSILELKFFPIQPATFIPTKPLQAMGGIDPDLHWAMDMDMWVKLAEELPFVHVPYDMALYRLHEGSKTSSASEGYYEDMAFILDRSVKKGLIEEKKARVTLNIFASILYFNPRVKKYAKGFKHLFSAVKEDIKTAPRALWIAGKAVFRPFINENTWIALRHLRAKPS